MPDAAVVAALPSGSILRRRRPLGDVWDVLRVEGFSDFAIDGGGTETEVVVRPANGHEPAVHVAIEALDASYLVVREGDWPPSDWATDPLDVLLRRDSTVSDPGGVTRIIADERSEASGQPSERVKRWADEHTPIKERVNDPSE